MSLSGPQYVGWYGHGRRQNWTTPRSLFDSLHAEYRFTMDGASEPGNSLLPRASTLESPLPWEGERVFCNPPWSNIPPFVELAATAELAVLLVPARTNVRWFHRALELKALPRFFPKRPKFGNAPDGNKGHNSPVDSQSHLYGREVGTMSAYERFRQSKQAEEMRMFHWRDNLYFGRLPDGFVRVVKFSCTPHAMWWHDDSTATTAPTEYPRADGEFRSVQVLLDIKIPTAEWASIVASVSKSGESDGRYAKAEAFHNE